MLLTILKGGSLAEVAGGALTTRAQNRVRCDGDRTGCRIVRLLSPALRWFLGVMFLSAGASKLFQPYVFLADVYGYGMLTENAGYFVAAILPWIEVIIGTALLLEVGVRACLILSTGLNVLFVIAKCFAIHTDRLIGCGCFVTAERGIVGVGDVLWGILLLAASSVVLWVSLRYPLGGGTRQSPLQPAAK